MERSFISKCFALQFVHEPFLTTDVGRVIEGRRRLVPAHADRAIAAQFEHTIVVTKNEPIILTLSR